LEVNVTAANATEPVKANAKAPNARSARVTSELLRVLRVREKVLKKFISVIILERLDFLTCCGQ